MLAAKRITEKSVLLAFVMLPFILGAAGCGSGACRQSPCVPGVPLLAGTCKCQPNEDGGVALDGAAAPD